MECLIRTEIPDQRDDAKMELIVSTSKLLPAGKPDFATVATRPAIAVLAQDHGTKTMRKVILLQVRSFCNSINVVRNMTEDQQIEAAAYLLDECGDMRLEDYQVMFAMAKRGELVKILDRIDIQVIAQILEAYWEKRNAFANKTQDAWYSDHDFKPSPRVSKEIDPAKLQEAMKQLDGMLNQWQGEVEEEKSKADAVSQEEIERRQRNIELRRKEWEGPLASKENPENVEPCE